MDNGLRAYIFPGQGAQRVGMGRDLVSSHPAARAVFDAADDALGERLSALCFDGPQDRLTHTANAQPALLVHAIATLEAARAAGAPDADAVAGHSLGEWTALVAAGVIRLEDAVRLVRVRGEAMQRAVPVGVGAMAAIIGSDPETVAAVCAETPGVVVPATFNGDAHIVISGEATAVDAASSLALERGAMKALPLDVSAPFHCPLMAPAQPALERALDGVELSAPKLAVYSTVSGARIDDVNDIRRALVEQLVAPTLWSQCLSAMVGAGVTRFTGVGAASSLARMVKRLRLGPAVDLLKVEAPEPSPSNPSA